MGVAPDSQFRYCVGVLHNKEVFNGDLEIVVEIDRTEKEVTIDFDDRDVVYDYADLNEITLDYSSLGYFDT